MNRTFKLLPLAVLITTAWAAQAQQVAYSPEMIRALVPAGQDVDMSFIEKGYNPKIISPPQERPRFPLAKKNGPED